MFSTGLSVRFLWETYFDNARHDLKTLMLQWTGIIIGFTLQIRAQAWGVLKWA